MQCIFSHRATSCQLNVDNYFDRSKQNSPFLFSYQYKKALLMSFLSVLALIPAAVLLIEHTAKPESITDAINTTNTSTIARRTLKAPPSTVGKFWALELYVSIVAGSFNRVQIESFVCVLLTTCIQSQSRRPRGEQTNAIAVHVRCVNGSCERQICAETRCASERDVGYA